MASIDKATTLLLKFSNDEKQRDAILDAARMHDYEYLNRALFSLQSHIQSIRNDLICERNKL